MQQVLDKYKARNFHILTINVMSDQEEGAVKIMSNYGFVSLKNPGGGFAWSSKTYGVRGTPTSFLIDPDGKIVFDVPGLESLDSQKLCDEEVGGLLAWTASSNSTRAVDKAQP